MIVVLNMHGLSVGISSSIYFLNCCSGSILILGFDLGKLQVPLVNINL